jgi:hypothetical protein
MRARLFSLTVITVAALGIVPAAYAATPQPVRIDAVVALAGNLEASTTTGSFSMSGAYGDSGTESGSGWFAGQGHLKTGDPNSLHSELVLAGTDGTITIELVGLFGQLPAPLATGEGRWVVADGTGAYAGAQGRGTWTAAADFRDAIAHVGPPRVSFVLDGTLN